MAKIILAPVAFRDTFVVLADDVTVGTVDSTRDRTGDWRAHRASGEIVAPRFTHQQDAVRYVTGEIERPALCLLSFGAYGSCIRERGHYAECVDAHGHHFAGK